MTGSGSVRSASRRAPTLPFSCPSPPHCLGHSRPPVLCLLGLLDQGHTSTAGHRHRDRESAQALPRLPALCPPRDGGMWPSPQRVVELMERLGIAVASIGHPPPRACPATRDIRGTPAVPPLSQRPPCFTHLFISPASQGFWLRPGAAGVPGGEGRDSGGQDLGC